MSAEELRALLESCTASGSGGDPHAPVICCGVNSQRFASSQFVGVWWVRTDTHDLSDELGLASAHPASSLGGPGASSKMRIADVTPHDEEKVVDFSPPRLWIDITGHRSNVLFRSCMEATLGHVMSRPGITEASLYRKLSSAMSRLELRDVLTEMVYRRVLRRTVFVRPKPVSLFSDIRRYRKVAPGEEPPDDVKVSCYFVDNDYYLKVSA
ncbi:MAG: hypothetical protein BJ554DRAFT_1239 [Olpidium bornovanus]|uniref:Uncharacterized protein n=1 Tax=Olpidium bornovanus TaxID=278681 RepID=A0A8H7ZSF5_9FUNG|nr:MAG: hypothetical protein BJ554DRAFT_1239 [Olpidium bornovanus]